MFAKAIRIKLESIFKMTQMPTNEKKFNSLKHHSMTLLIIFENSVRFFADPLRPDATIWKHPAIRGINR